MCIHFQHSQAVWYVAPIIKTLSTLELHLTQNRGYKITYLLCKQNLVFTKMAELEKHGVRHRYIVSDHFLWMSDQF